MKLRVMVIVLVAALAACKKDSGGDKPVAKAPEAGSGSAAKGPDDKPLAPDPAVAPAAGDGVKLPRPAPKVGDKRVETEAMTMEITIDDKGTKHAIKNTRSKVEEREALAVDGDRVTKFKVTYKAVEESQTVDGAARSKPSLVVGKTYIVEVSPDKVAVTSEAGTPIPDAELAEATKRADELRTQNRLENVMASKTFHLGQKVELTADDLAQMNTGEVGSKMLSASFTLKAVDDATATFATVLVVEETNPLGVLKAELTADAVIDRKRGEPVSVVGSGPMTGIATGTMTAKTSYTYSP
jgi:hypothetical protein